MKKVEVNLLAKYSNHSVKENGIVVLCLKAQYSQLSKSILCSQMLNEDVSIKVALKKDSILSLGSFRIKKLLIDGDGESKLIFSSTNEAVELNSLNKVSMTGPDGLEFKTKLTANIDTEKEEEEE